MSMSQADLDYCINLIANLRHQIQLDKNMGVPTHRDVINQLHTFTLAAQGDFSVPQLEELNRRCNAVQLDLQLAHNQNLADAETVFQHDKQVRINRNAIRGVSKLTQGLKPDGKSGMTMRQFKDAQNHGKYVEKPLVTNKNRYANRIFDEYAKRAGISRKKFLENVEHVADLERLDPRKAAEKAVGYGIDPELMDAWSNSQYGSLSYTKSQRDWENASKEEKSPTVVTLDENSERKLDIMKVLLDNDEVPYEDEAVHPKHYMYGEHDRSTDVAMAYQHHESEAFDKDVKRDYVEDTLRESLSAQMPDVDESYGAEMEEDY